MDGQATMVGSDHVQRLDGNSVGQQGTVGSAFNADSTWAKYSGVYPCDFKAPVYCISVRK
jgi:hypothetical protein